MTEFTQIRAINCKNHISFEERQIIETLKNQGKSLQYIANALGRGKTSIKQEYGRCPKGKYNAEEAQKFYEDVWKNRSRKLLKKFSSEDESKIRMMMNHGATRSFIRRALGCSFCRVENWFLENEPDYQGGSVLSLDRRLSNIEQQIEILFELIGEKDVKNK